MIGHGLILHLVLLRQKLLHGHAQGDIAVRKREIGVKREVQAVAPQASVFHADAVIKTLDADAGRRARTRPVPQMTLV